MRQYQIVLDGTLRGFLVSDADAAAGRIPDGAVLLPPEADAPVQTKPAKPKNKRRGVASKA